MVLDVCLTGVSFDEIPNTSRQLRLNQHDSTAGDMLLNDSETSDATVLGTHAHLDKSSYEEYSLRDTWPTL